ncbi:MAG: response regulator transcription factor [Magnetococcales bacterium]|nr:response regulator transcription factor [Magnetococcales bacterium]MBF0148525.1 response regulator transcription factor [Magnetococcales bacterium]MBF0172646.1 response regulator transcription factor [Magnetococcales bacterium]MBF0346508.1 response regulator transcription factor [Magnetococcales bacterium]MBF0629783.1 response regulator transcription factor [Magnetococcales bacterium]
MIRILLADDHSIFREGLKRILAERQDMVIAGEVENGDEVVIRLQAEPWDLLLLDVSMPGKNTLELVTLIHQQWPALPILILTMHRDRELAIRFIRAGARGFLTKDCGLEQLLHGIGRVAMGNRYIDEEMADDLMEHIANNNGDTPPHSLLSNREFTVLCRIASGQTVTRIAADLSLSISAISSYRNRLLTKLGLENNAQLTHYALKNNLVK